VAVVTGGGSGLGAAMAKGLAQAGAALAVVDVNDEGASRTVWTIE
jgi:NAD(P)-dependent dehydrogenase (short-subunit alcohol dehydrogenase family)